MSKLIAKQENPYVYALVDSRDEGIFYVGKGRKNRMYQHKTVMRKARELLGRVKPYVSWVNEKMRTSKESDMYYYVIAEFHQVIALCERNINENAKRAC